MYGAFHGSLAATLGVTAGIIGLQNILGYTVLGAALIFASVSIRPLLPTTPRWRWHRK